MNDWRNPYQETTPGGSVEYLRALKRSNEGQPTPTAASQPSATVERRSAVRYKCQGSAEFRIEGTNVRTWGTVTDISRSGCYVELSATSPIDTAVNMQIELEGIRLCVKGKVRTSHPYVGMGIAFTEMEEADGARLGELLLRLSGGAAAPRIETKSSPTPTALLMVTNPASALNAIVEFFQNHPTMSRDDFEELIRQSQNPGQWPPR